MTGADVNATHDFLFDCISEDMADVDRCEANIWKRMRVQEKSV